MAIWLFLTCEWMFICLTSIFWRKRTLIDAFNSEHKISWRLLCNLNAIFIHTFNWVFLICGKVKKKEFLLYSFHVDLIKKSKQMLTLQFSFDWQIFKHVLFVHFNQRNIKYLWKHPQFNFILLSGEYIDLVLRACNNSCTTQI